MAPHARVPIRLRHSRNTRSATAPCTPCPRSDLHHARQLQQSALRTTAGSVGSWMRAHRICGPVTELDASCSALNTDGGSCISAAYCRTPRFPAGMPWP